MLQNHNASNGDQAAESQCKIGVVIPCFRVHKTVEVVLSQIDSEISAIYCVVDACPDGSQHAVERAAKSDPRIQVLLHTKNAGVGAAFATGMRQALSDEIEIVVKLDGDGQMLPADIARLLRPILQQSADFSKGNRFSHLKHLKKMPWVRLIGNAGLSFFSKLSSGYWNVFDPTNGFFAIHSKTATLIDWDNVSPRYFFESDLLFRLGLLRAVVVDIPLPARYGDEKSDLSLSHTLVSFPVAHTRNFAARIFYNYFLRDFHFATIQLVVGSILLLFGITFGAIHWMHSVDSREFSSSGTVMLAALPVILGWQALLGFISFDLHNVPKDPLFPKLGTTDIAASSCKPNLD